MTADCSLSPTLHREKSKKKKQQGKGKAERKAAPSKAPAKSPAKQLGESFKSKEFVSSEESSGDNKKEVGAGGAGGASAPIGSCGCMWSPVNTLLLPPQDSEEEEIASTPPSMEDSASGSD